jgi:alkylation response protein AidB-like acyl-CoA dehydrogenase
VLDTARRIADEVLFPAAMKVDGADRVPAAHLDLLAEEGFYGFAADGTVDLTTAARVVETLASGCLATTFVWLQHHGAVRAVAASTLSGVPEKWLEPLVRGQCRAGVVLAGLRPGPASVRVRAAEGGYLINGEAPWVTGWSMVDVLHTAARDEDDTIVWLLVDAVSGPTLAVEPLELAAVNASRTVSVRFTDHFVPADRLTGSMPYRDWPARDAAGLRMNGSLALGVVARCCALVGGARMVDELDAARRALDEAGPEELPAARAAASVLATRAATTLAVTVGSRSILVDEHPQRLIREAAFLLVFGSRPAIRESLLGRLLAS